MQSTTEVMVASILAEGAVMGESVNKIIKVWRARGCVIPVADERVILGEFDKRQGLDKLKISILHHVIDYIRKNAKDPQAFRTLHPAPKVSSEFERRVKELDSVEPDIESIEAITEEEEGGI